MRVYYVFYRGADTEGSQTQSIDLSDKEVVFGRGDGEVRLDDKLCSRRHASFFLNEGKACIRDLGSRNGTYVNEERITQAYLFPGKIIRLGRTRLRILKITPEGADANAEPQEELVALNESAAPQPAAKGEVLVQGSVAYFFESLPRERQEKFTRYIK